jgi:outer membrane protein assembly factor BamC
MKSLLSQKTTRVLALLAAVVMLNGCSSMREALEGGDSVDYKSVKRADPLSIPPDLTQAASDPRFRAPDSGATTFSQFQQAGTAPGSSQAAVLPARADMRVMRDGDLRWLSVDMPADKVFSTTADFWTETGFTLDVTDPKAGVLVTNWAENRANIPNSWIRQAIGKVLPALWDSGQREKFRTRIERTGNRTEIYITHQQMNEEGPPVGPNTSPADIKWVFGKEDPGLNAIMLARLMVFLGEDADGARRKIAQANADPQGPKVSMAGTDQSVLVIAETFDRAWRRVSVALDSGGFAVEDRDRSAGEFFVRYVDTDTGLKREEPGIFSRMFGAKQPSAAPTYRLRLTTKGTQTEVIVLDDKGVKDNSPTARRLLSVLADKI